MTHITFSLSSFAMTLQTNLVDVNDVTPPYFSAVEEWNFTTDYYKEPQYGWYFFEMKQKPMLPRHSFNDKILIAGGLLLLTLYLWTS